MVKSTLGALTFLLVATITYVVFGSFFLYLIQTWKIDPFYRHGPYVFLTAVGLYGYFWVRVLRSKTSFSEAGEHPTGGYPFKIILVGITAFLTILFFVLGAITHIPFCGGLAFIFWMLFVHRLFFGHMPLRAYAFPFFFFLCAVPLPYLGEVSGILQILISKISYLFFQGFGYPLTQQGIYLSFPTATFEIAPDCTGIKSWIVLFSICLFFIYFLRITWRAKCFILLSLIPIAFLSNWIRVMTLLFIGYYGGEDLAFRFWHHFSGLMFYLLSCIGVIFSMCLGFYYAKVNSPYPNG